MLLRYELDKASSVTVVVNKSRPLTPVQYAPAKFGAYNLAKPASDALSKMRLAMAKAGAGELLLSSGYRGYQTQKAIYQSKVALLGLAAGQRLAAKPGFSEHQTGLAADLSAVGQGCSIRVCFAETKAGRWLAKNSWRYGFILRYPNGATKITGYQFEPWHFRFEGKPLATAMHQAKANVLESFLGLPRAPRYGLPTPTN
jgi:D-alanyl-D-alanine carboxypeptidase